MEEFFFEYLRCEDKISFNFINCTEECKGNPTCFDKCQADALVAHKNCPCRENCESKFFVLIETVKPVFNNELFDVNLFDILSLISISDGCPCPNYTCG